MDRFNISGTSLRITSSPNYESKSSYSVRIQTDDGTDTYSEAFTITINDVNEAPGITSSSTANVEENTTSVLTITSSDPDGAFSPTYSIIGGADQAKFSINSGSGVLSFSSAPDYENSADANTDNIYEVQIQVSDGSLDNSQTISVTVTDANDKPTAAGFSTSDGPYMNVVYTFSTSDFGYIDQDGDPIHALRIYTKPATGLLFVDDNDNGSFDEGEQALTYEYVYKSDLDAGRLKFITSVSSSTSFKFDVHDGDDLSVLQYTVTLNVLAIPTVTTQAVSGIGTTSATGNGTITDLGSSNPTAHGVCYSTLAIPTTSDNVEDNGAASITGAFTASLTGLTPNTTYYLRAYATNATGTAYGSEVTFTTGIGELTWNGSESTNWHTANNWTPATVPTAGYNVTIPAGLTNYPVLSVAGACNNLTIESSVTSTGSLTGQSNLTVNGTTTVERYMTGNAWHLVSSAVPNESIADFLSANTNVSTNGSSRGMMDYDESINDWNTFFLNSGQSGSLTPGKGFSLRTDADGTVTFDGSLAIGTVNTTVARTDNFGWNCVGNPYASAIYVNDAADADNNFIDLNASNLDASYSSIYVWDQLNEAYSIIALGDAAFYAQVGQAFFVKANSEATQVQFTTAMQTHQSAAAFKSGTVASPEIGLKVTMDDRERATRIKFNDAMTTGLDVGYDAGVFKTGFDIYTQLVEDNGVDFGLQSLPLSNIKSYEIPVGVEVKEAGDISFSLYQENFQANVIPVLTDKKAGKQFVFTGESNVYTTTVSAEENGYGRFVLTFSSVTGIENLLPQPLSYKAWCSNGQIIISGETTGDAVVAIYDVQGRKLATHQLENTNLNHIEAPAATAGIYLLHIQDSGRTKVLKVVSTRN